MKSSNADDGSMRAAAQPGGLWRMGRLQCLPQRASVHSVRAGGNNNYPIWGFDSILINQRSKPSFRSNRASIARIAFLPSEIPFL